MCVKAYNAKTWEVNAILEEIFEKIIERMEALENNYTSIKEAEAFETGVNDAINIVKQTVAEYKEKEANVHTGYKVGDLYKATVLYLNETGTGLFVSLDDSTVCQCPFPKTGKIPYAGQQCMIEATEKKSGKDGELIYGEIVRQVSEGGRK